MPTYVVIDDTEVAPEAPVTSSLMTRLRDNAIAYLGAAAGVRLLVHNATAPLGWTIDTAHNNKSIRISNGAIPGGGSHGFTTVFSLRSTDPDLLSVAELPNFTPSVAVNGLTYGLVSVGSAPTNYVAGVPGAGQSNVSAIQSLSLASQPVGGSLTMNSVGGNTAWTTTVDLRVAYIDTNLVEKDA